MIYAPVLIPTLNRHVHLKRCIDSLSVCKHADKTDLYVALDYPFNQAHFPGYDLVLRVLRDITGFRNVYILRRDHNYGAFENIQDARDEVFKTHDTIIISEDDNEFSPNFLEYMNKGLSKFEGDNRVSGICGYSYPIVIPKEYDSNFFYHPQLSSWGAGHWKSKWSRAYYSVPDLQTIVCNSSFTRKLRQYSAKHISDLRAKIVRKEEVRGDLAYFLRNVECDTYNVFPVVSKVRNFGHDGSGIHCGTIRGFNPYAVQQIDTEESFTFEGEAVYYDEGVNVQLKKYFSKSYLSKVRIYLSYLLYLSRRRCKNRG